METKECSNCKNVYPATTDHFHKASRLKCGLTSWCKGCRNSYNRIYKEEYHKTHKERIPKNNLHVWVRRRKDAPKLCVMCNEEKTLELANLSGEYYLDIRDFIWICKSCHSLLDRIYKEEKLK